ncbi:MAG: ribokinase [Candidatus Bipolaricaulia bacterium]
MEIAVLGSINMDLVVRVERFPEPGETIVGRSFAQFPGGKGANQAVGAARLDGDVGMLGMIGDDIFGEQLKGSLEKNGVRIDDLVSQPSSSGVASILVDDAGENLITIIAGANGNVDNEYVETVLPKIGDAKILLLQLEIPLGTIDHLLRRLSAGAPLVILDPAPVRDLSDLYTERIDLITPNRTELAGLVGIELQHPRAIERAAVSLSKRTGIETVICKWGAEGAYLSTAGQLVHLPGYRVKAIDTTAAGDAFNAGLAVALSRGRDLEAAVGYANAVAALSVTAEGAQPSMPTGAQVEAFLEQSAESESKH